MAQFYDRIHQRSGGSVASPIPMTITDLAAVLSGLNQGDILGTDASGMMAALPAGTLGQVLAIDPTAPLGIAWVDPVNPAFAFQSRPDADIGTAPTAAAGVTTVQSVHEPSGTIVVWTRPDDVTPFTVASTTLAGDGNPDLYPVIPRGDAVRDVAPTAAEAPNPKAGDMVPVLLSDGTKQYFSYDGTAWVTPATLTVEPDSDSEIATLGPFAGAAPTGVKFGIDQAAKKVYFVDASGDYQLLIDGSDAVDDSELWQPNFGDYTADNVFTISTASTSAVDSDGTPLQPGVTYLAKYNVAPGTSAASLTDAEIGLMEIITSPPATEIDVVGPFIGAAPDGKALGIDPATGQMYRVDGAGNWTEVVYGPVEETIYRLNALVGTAPTNADLQYPLSTLTVISVTDLEDTTVYWVRPDVNSPFVALASTDDQVGPAYYDIEAADGDPVNILPTVTETGANVISGSVARKVFIPSGYVETYTYNGTLWIQDYTVTPTPPIDPWITIDDAFTGPLLAGKRYKLGPGLTTLVGGPDEAITLAGVTAGTVPTDADLTAPASTLTVSVVYDDGTGGVFSRGSSSGAFTPGGVGIKTQSNDKESFKIVDSRGIASDTVGIFIDDEGTSYYRDQDDNPASSTLPFVFNSKGGDVTVIQESAGNTEYKYDNVGVGSAGGGSGLTLAPSGNTTSTTQAISPADVVALINAAPAEFLPVDRPDAQKGVVPTHPTALYLQYKYSDDSEEVWARATTADPFTLQAASDDTAGPSTYAIDPVAYSAPVQQPPTAAEQTAAGITVIADLEQYSWFRKPLADGSIEWYQYDFPGIGWNYRYTTSAPSTASGVTQYTVDNSLTLTAADFATGDVVVNVNTDTNSPTIVIPEGIVDRNLTINKRGANPITVTVGTANNESILADGEITPDATDGGIIIDKSGTTRLHSPPAGNTAFTGANWYEIYGTVNDGGAGDSVTQSDYSIALEQTSDFTAVAGHEYPIDVRSLSVGQSITVTPPTNPQPEEGFAFFDSRKAASTDKTIVITALLHGSAGDTATINSPGAHVQLRYVNASIGWRLIGSD